MAYNNDNLLELLNYIDPSMLDYSQWLAVGMAVKASGFTVSDWENWSARDSKRYHKGECAVKWNSFTDTGVTAGTIVKLAFDFGYKPSKKEEHELDWSDTINAKSEIIIDTNWIEKQSITPPEKWNAVNDIITYLETLFDSTDNVGYVTESWEKDGKFMPKSGSFSRTAGELTQALYKCNGDIGAVLGDYNPQVGAWIRFNPLDGKGVKNENVTEFRYALVESDNMDIESQNAIIRELELPVACLVHSGKKSLHAIVHIGAGSYEEYRCKVDYLYKVCEKNGLELDKQNRNPSRLSRMPGVTRNGEKQYLIDTNIGKASFEQWKDWVESINDDLPDEESLETFWDDMPNFSPTLIDGVLRQGHKMLIAGPSKAGKSFLLINLCCSIAEGLAWLGFKCTKGKVLYVNLELDRASCFHRFKDTYNSLGYKPSNLKNIEIWNLRGNSVPMDKLAPKLIRRAKKKNYLAIVIDPIYKIITGDENSADQMAKFCNQFDKVCTELNCAVIYCHHHSKGGQAGKKSMDRASGSGVFARDPDALIDLMEIDVSEDIFKNEENNLVCAICKKWLMRYGKQDVFSQDDECSSFQMLTLCKTHLQENSLGLLMEEIREAKEKLQSRTAWQIEGTLREFPKFKPMQLWFDYPVHKIDKTGVLKDVVLGEKTTTKGSPWKKNFSNKKSPEQAKKEKQEGFETAFSAVEENGKATVKELAEYMGVTEKTVRNRVKDNQDYWCSDGEIGLK